VRVGDDLAVVSERFEVVAYELVEAELLGPTDLDRAHERRVDRDLGDHRGDVGRRTRLEEHGHGTEDVAGRRLEEVEHLLVGERRRVRHVDHDLGAIEHLDQPFAGERVHARVR
jgi:hypothetical protein